MSSQRTPEEHAAYENVESAIIELFNASHGRLPADFDPSEDDESNYIDPPNITRLLDHYVIVFNMRGWDSETGSAIDNRYEVHDRHENTPPHVTSGLLGRALDIVRGLL